MQIRTVATLEEAAKDLDAGKAFYDKKGEGIGLKQLKAGRSKNLDDSLIQSIRKRGRERLNG